MDIHICGACHSQYSTIEEFIQHKNTNCTRTVVNVGTAHTGTSHAGIGPPEKTLPEQRRPEYQSRPDVNSTIVSSMTTIEELDFATSDCQVSSTISLPQKPAKKRSRKKCTETSVKTVQAKKGCTRTKLRQYVKQFKCTYESCKFVTAHRKDLKRHHLIHTGEKPFGCQFCLKHFSRKDKRKLHERKHTQEKPFKCSIPTCDYMCADRGSLNKHLRIHSDERPHQCQLCPYASRTASQLVVHLRRHTGDAPFHCQQCEAKFKTNTDLKRHMLIHTGEKRFLCDECDYKSHLKCNLKSHIASNHRGRQKYLCEKCPFKCRTQRQLRKHVGDDHTRPSYECLQCTFTTFRKDAFKQHRRKHDGEPLYKCSFCQYSAKRTRVLISHIKKNHPDKASLTETGTVTVKTKGNPPCKGKMKKRALKVTVPIVDGKRPFKCGDCDDSFVREDSFRSHQRQHEQLSGMSQRAANTVADTQPKDTPIFSDNHANDSVAVPSATEGRTNTLRGEESQRLLAPTVSTSIHSVSRGNAMPSKEFAKEGVPSGVAGDALDLQRMPSEMRQDAVSILSPQQGVQAIRIIQGNKVMSVVNPHAARSSGADPLINIISSPCRSLDPTQDFCPQQTEIHARPHHQSSQIVSEGLQRNQDDIHTADSSDRVTQDNSIAEPASGCADEGQMDVQLNNSGQSPVVQSQTLGYGTSNLPVVFATLVPSSPQTSAILPSAPPCGQAIVINDMAPQLQSRCSESIPGQVVQASVGVPNGTVAGLAGNVQFVYANPLSVPQPVGVSNIHVLQQAATTQQPQQQQQQQRQQLQQLNLTGNEQRPQLPALVSYVTTSGLPLSSTPSVAIMNQSQRGLSLQAPVPTGSFILSGRAIRRGPPTTNEMSSANVTTLSQSLQRS